MIKHDAFLALEASLANRLGATLKKITKPLYAEIEKAIAAQDFQKAIDLVQRISLNSVFEDNKKYIEYLSHMAMLFGATRVSINPGTSVVGLGFQKDTVQQSLQTFQYSAVQRAEEYLKENAMQLIAQHRMAAGGPETIQKFNPNHEPAGSPQGGQFAHAKGTSTASYGKATEGATTVTGVHFSTDQRPQLNSSFYGQGLTGAERERVAALPKEYQGRIHFYVNEGSGVTPEAGVGAHAHSLTMNNLYDVGADSRNIVANSKGSDWEKAVVDAGYDGYYAPGSFGNQGTAVLIGNHTVNPQYHGPNYDAKDIAPPVVSAPSKYKQDLKAVMSDKSLPAGEMSGADWKKVMSAKHPDIDLSHLDDTQTYYRDKLVAVPSVKKAEGDRAILPFAPFMNDAGKSYFDITSSLHTSRLSAYGFTAEADATGQTTYQINEVLDKRTCPVCEVMHGMQFSVEDAKALLDVVVRTQNPEELKSLQPWPSQSKAGITKLKGMKQAEIIAMGWHIPPFHPRCRGLLGRVGRVGPHPSSPEAQKPPTEAYKPSVEDFKAVGITAKPEQLDMWMEMMGMSPAEVLASLVGENEGELLEALVGGLSLAKTKGMIGLKKLAITDGEIAITMNSKAFGSTEDIYQSLKFMEAEQQTYLSVLELAAADQGAGLVKKYMKNLVALSNDLGMKSIGLQAGLDVGGYAWAKYGFAPDVLEWDALKKVIAAKVESENILLGKSALQVKAYKSIMQSTNPESLFALSDIPELGKEILLGTTWAGKLDLTNPEAMTRFMAYIGTVK